MGKVEKIELDGDHVKVTFRVKTDSEFGAETGAAIRVNTLLGAMYLALEPAGSGQLDEGNEIPVERTSSPYDVVEAFSGLAETVRARSTPTSWRLADHAGRPDPQHPRGVQGGALGRLAALGQHRGAERADQHAAEEPQRVSTVLNERDEDIVGLMKDSDVLFQALVARREAVHDLLVSTSDPVRPS